MKARLLLPAPPVADHPTHRARAGTPEAHLHARSIDGNGWSIVEHPGPTPLDIVREQRDGLARLQNRLLTAIRQLEAENESLRGQIARYQHFPSVEEQEDELADAARLELEQGIEFQRMPRDVYPGKPYVTLLDLIRHGVTRYSRQNISRLTRDERSVPAVLIADRVLLAPAGVKRLLEREKKAETDVSPRRRPGPGRAAEPRTR